MVPEVRLTGPAARFLHMVQDLGHLDEEGVSQVLLAIRVADPAEGPAIADLDVVRGAVAQVLFRNAGDEEMSPILAEDWPLLFS